LGISQLAVDWVPVTIETAAGAISGGQADVLCTPANATLARRKTLSFSLPVFAGGIRAVVRKDITPQVREALENNPRTRPVWRGTPAQGMVEATRFATVAGTSSEKWLAAGVRRFQLNTATVSVPDYASGIKFLLENKIDVFFAERDVALAAMDEKASDKLMVLHRQLTQEPLALALPRDDEDLRLAVDTALSNAYSAADFPTLYGKYFGTLDDSNRTFFSWVTPAP
jgi:polar amino acid transport system substrate-binding protein